MLPGNHFTRTTYGPGLLGSPNSTADSFVPAAFRTHLISDGVLKSTAVRSMSAACVAPTRSAIERTTRTLVHEIALTLIGPPSSQKFVRLSVGHEDVRYFEREYSRSLVPQSIGRHGVSVQESREHPHPRPWVELDALHRAQVVRDDIPRGWAAGFAETGPARGPVPAA